MSGINGGLDYSLDLNDFSPEIQEQIKTLQKGVQTPRELIETTKILAGYTDKRIVPVLVDILGFNNPVAARIAMEAVVGFGIESKGFLVKATGAFNYAVNAYALKALGLLGFPDTIEVCLHHASQGTVPNVRRAAIIAIGRLRYRETELLSVIESLSAFLYQTDWSVRYAAVVSIESLLRQYSRQRNHRVTTVAKLKEMASSDDDFLVRCRTELALQRVERQNLS
ncbi:Phycocyanobilin lyase subunit beta [Galdieria sulphuraria]|uniref:Phycocyanobilin lyase beta subunit (CpcF) n=1 Tax=Galdieria sulphuraria TaxID=130081 RepID=M2VSN3_GALSU|nr:phycocyanobilin lyase beta subunit (CpcF) [Galdieria sulphuraria]EME26156.1 phycocyanobilin lyase beta subunit (CpcF) [Galdieria sulphuraria]GJD11731.1 Phycocyanobilin lyase subunit beta [Galdieria sulphuraria]|eukprot:XP_005702676.1 phycocyanobilin lyase beta subunit (CpcF) [Galdieria sulphuraria]